MMSTSITKVGGIVIVTQILPQDADVKNVIPLQTTNPSPPAPPTIPDQPVTPPPTRPATPAKMSAMMSMFLRGEPQCLGIVQIFVGLLCVLFGLTFIISSMLTVNAPLFAGVAFVLSGSLSVAARRRSSVLLIVATLASNLLSVLLAGMGVAYLCWLLADRSSTEQHLCGVKDVMAEDQLNTTARFHKIRTTDRESECLHMVWYLNVVLDGLRGILAILLLLQFCIAISLSVFSAKAISLRGRYGTTVLVDDIRSGLIAQPPSMYSSNVALLDSEEVGTPPSLP